MRGGWWWIDRWRKSTAFTDMSLEEQGAYRNLCDEVVLREGGVIPEESLAKACGDPRKWPRIAARVLRWMKRVPGGWTNETALAVRAGAERFSAAQKARISKRWIDTGVLPGKNRGDTEKHTLDDTGSVPPFPLTDSKGGIESVVQTPLEAYTHPAPSEPLPGTASQDSSAKDLTLLPSPSGGPKKTPSWLEGFAALWRLRWGSESVPPFGEMAREFSRKEAKALPPGDLVRRWKRFLAAADRPEWARPGRFMQGLGQWTESGPSPSGSVARVAADVAAFNADHEEDE